MVLFYLVFKNEEKISVTKKDAKRKHKGMKHATLITKLTLKMALNKQNIITFFSSKLIYDSNVFVSSDSNVAFQNTCVFHQMCVP